MYSPTGAQAYILDSVIESFNEKVVDHINILWSNLTYELKSYKETVKGDVTAKFSECLVMDGKSVSIGSLSGGEFRALSLCVDFALIDVMERQFGISISPIILDEPYDGLDASGKALITELLETLAVNRQIVVVDHSSEINSMFSKVIKVEKRNGVSTVSLES
jgi:DNA repair exonuclease SbcCD ATPase subunit